MKCESAWSVGGHGGDSSEGGCSTGQRMWRVFNHQHHGIGNHQRSEDIELGIPVHGNSGRSGVAPRPPVENSTPQWGGMVAVPEEGLAIIGRQDLLNGTLKMPAHA